MTMQSDKRALGVKWERTLSLRAVTTGKIVTGALRTVRLCRHVVVETRHGLRRIGRVGTNITSIIREKDFGNRCRVLSVKGRISIRCLPRNDNGVSYLKRCRTFAGA
jgi:hypothetical protein